MHFEFVLFCECHLKRCQQGTKSEGHLHHAQSWMLETCKDQFTSCFTQVRSEFHLLSVS